VCRKPTFQQLLSAAGFQLKGSGWYATDFKNKASKPAEKKAEEKSEAKTETKTDTKPEKKTESKSEAAA
jgi:predicted nucleic acid-binding Zn ribbon protein